MPRQPRLKAPDTIFHITSRGNAQQTIFTCDNDRTLFLNLLQSVLHMRRWRCHAYCLMNNHYHMAVEVSEDDLSEGMREINHRYALLFNKTQGKSGHLFQDRFHSKIVSDDYYMMELSRYIVLNPVRASIVPAPQLWPWSSYSDLLSGTGIAEHGFVLSLFSDDCDSALAEYNEFISEATGETFQWNEIRDYLFGAGKLPRPSLAAIFNGSKGRDIHIAEARFLHGYKLREIADFLSMSNAQIHRLAKSNRELIWKEMR